MGIASVKQPVPKNGAKTILRMLLNLGINDNNVAFDLTERAAIGMQTYGSYLSAHNERSAAIDLYQELLDAIYYAQQLFAEDNTPLAKQVRDSLITLTSLVRGRAEEDYVILYE